MTEKKDGALRPFLRRNGAALLLAALLFGVVYGTTFYFRHSNTNSDFTPHLMWAIGMTGRDMFESLFNGSERLWHIVTNLLYRLVVRRNIWAAAALVTAAADTAAFFLVYKIWDRSLPEKCPRWLLALLTAAVFFVNALSLPGSSMYKQPGAVNTWHSPTNIMVRPFAAAVFYMTVNIYDRRRYGRHSLYIPPEEAKSRFSFSGGLAEQFRQPVFTRAELVLYPSCLLLSTWAKPCFIQFFAPAIFLFLLYDVFRTRGKLLPFCIKLALAYLPVVLVVAQQFLHFFKGNVSVASEEVAQFATAEAATAAAKGLAIYYLRPVFSGPGEVLRLTGQHIWRYLRLGAFPLFVLAVSAWRGIGGGASRLALTGSVVAKLENMFLHELGKQATHGNFSWGHYTAMWLMWTVAAGLFAALWQEKGRGMTAVRLVGAGLLCWHLVSGVVYLVRIFPAGTYLF